jgi:hypothetical protein
MYFRSDNDDDKDDKDTGTGTGTGTSDEELGGAVNVDDRGGMDGVSTSNNRNCEWKPDSFSFSFDDDDAMYM